MFWLQKEFGTLCRVLDVRPGSVDVGSVVDAGAPGSSAAASFVAGSRSTNGVAAAILPTADQACWDGKDA